MILKWACACFGLTFAGCGTLAAPHASSLQPVNREALVHLVSSPSEQVSNDAINSAKNAIVETSSAAVAPFVVPDEFQFETVPLESDTNADSPSVFDRLVNDQFHYYSRDSMLGLGLVAVAGGALANTDTDRNIHKHFQASVRGASSDEWFEMLHANKELGNGVYTLPIMGAAWVAGTYFDASPRIKELGTWGERSTRGFIVGAPPLIALQQLTGGSRPGETSEGSEWHPFHDNNGVSGHAFMASLPFITAAKIADSPWEKSVWYLASTLGPLSRVNDNAHYPSQIGMGWAMAFVAASAIQQTDTGQRGWTIVPHSLGEGTGFAMQYRW